MPTLKKGEKDEEGRPLRKTTVKSFSRLIRDLPTIFDGKPVQVSQALPSVVHSGTINAGVRVRHMEVLSGAYDPIDAATGSERLELLKERATQLQYYATTENIMRDYFRELFPSLPLPKKSKPNAWKALREALQLDPTVPPNPKPQKRKIKGENGSSSGSSADEGDAEGSKRKPAVKKPKAAAPSASVADEEAAFIATALDIYRAKKGKK